MSDPRDRAYPPTSPPTLVSRPLVPPPPARRPKKRAPPWILLAVVGACAAIAAILIFVALPRVTDDAPASSKPTAQPASAPPRSPRGKIHLAQITPRDVIERAQDAGYEVVNNSERDLGGMSTLAVGLRKGPQQAAVMLYRCKNIDAARVTEETFAKASDAAVLREGTDVLAVRVSNGAEPGNAASRSLLAAIVR